MSSRVATLVVGLLAIAEGRSNDREILREANTDEVLDYISPQMLDRIAHRLYAEDSSEMSAYERLLQEDKRRKMDYLNNIRPDTVPEANYAPVANDAHHVPIHHADDHVRRNDMPATAENIERALRRTEHIDERLTQQRHIAQAEREYVERRRD